MTKSREDREFEERFANAMKAREGIIEDAKGKRGVAGSITCPVCLGVLRYGIAHNGHVRAKCETHNCLAWME